MSFKPINLQWNQPEPYLIGLVCRAAPSKECEQALKSLGMAPGPALELGTWQCHAPPAWVEMWEKIEAALVQHGAADMVEAVVTPTAASDEARWHASRLSVAKVREIAQSLWLGRALQREGGLLCYLQPVLGAQGQVFGFESFARVRRQDGSIAAGGAIVQACRALGIEYALDRQLQVLAIRTFAKNGGAGSLFINFFPGFIQRPEVYLEGLTETVKAEGVVSRNIVLDVTRSGSAVDVAHVKRVGEYCRSKGYALALDDVDSVKDLPALLPDVQPNFVKMDMRLAQRVGEDRGRDTIRAIVDACHARGVMVISEGVETRDMLEHLRALGVDLFQGYYFSAPLPAEEAVQFRFKDSV